jgi:hypothetical protein
MFSAPFSLFSKHPPGGMRRPHPHLITLASAWLHGAENGYYCTNIQVCAHPEAVCAFLKALIWPRSKKLVILRPNKSKEAISQLFNRSL